MCHALDRLMIPPGAVAPRLGLYAGKCGQWIRFGKYYFLINHLGKP